MRGRDPRPAHPDVHRRGSPLRAAARRRPRAGLGDAVRGSPRRRARLAARRRPSSSRRPHAERRAACAAGLRLVPRRRARAGLARGALARRARPRGSRRPLVVLEGAATRRGGMARRAAAARRPGLRGRGLARDARLHRGATGHERAAGRAGCRLRGVHAPLPRVLVRPGHPLAALDRPERDGLRRPRRPRRLEHLVELGRGDAREAVVGRPHHRRVHGVLDLPAHREPLAARARRGDDARARQARRRRRAAPPGGRPQVGPRVGREPLGLPPRLRRLAAPRRRLARRARARRRPSRDGRRGGVGLDRRPFAGRVRPSRDREHAARLHAPRHPPPRGVERGRLRRALGQGRRAARRAPPAQRRPRALGGVRRVVRPAVRLVAQSRHRRGRHDASRVDRPARRRRAQQLPRRGRSRRGCSKPRLPDRLLAVPQPARAARAAHRPRHRIARRPR